MISAELEGIFFQVIVLGALSVFMRILLRIPIVTASLAFWVGWAFLIGGGLIAEYMSWAHIGRFSIPYISTMLYGAFVGFTLGMSSYLVTGNRLEVLKRNREQYLELIYYSTIITRRITGWLLILLFSVGMLFLLQRIFSVGLSADYLSDVRAVYLQRDASILLRLGSHLSTVVVMLVILRGVRDAYSTVDIRSLAIIILAGAPLGLANGGRGFLLSYFLAYFASLLICRSNDPLKTRLMSGQEVFQVGGILALSLLIFAVMGFIRGGYGDQFNILYTIIIWPVSTLGAMDSWVHAALSSDSTYGLNSFGWLFETLSELGAVNISDATGVMKTVIGNFYRSHDSAQIIPRSILPDLIFDFGKGGVFWGAAIIAGLLEVVSTRLAGKGILLHTLAVLSLLAGFKTIQNSVVTPGVVATLFWALVAATYFRINRDR